MIQIENISKVFRTTEVETVALNHVNLEVKETRRVCCYHGAFGLWKIHFVEYSGFIG